MRIKQTWFWFRVIIPIGTTFLSLAYGLYWRFLMPQRERQNQKKRILFVAHNQMMAKYLSQIADLLTTDNRVEIFATSPVGGRKVVYSCFDSDHTTYVRYRWSRFQWWDLIVFAEHASVDKYHPQIKRLYTSHGIPSGARCDGNNEYGYGPRVFNSDGEPAYTMLVEQSEANQQRIAQLYPGLAERICVIGDLRIESLLAMNKSRETIRKQLGFESDDIVCLFMSSWQGHSLLPTLGKDLIEEAKNVMPLGKYKFVIASHPNLWSVHNQTQKPWDEYLLLQRKHGFTVIEPTEEWEKYLAASDLAFADSTSLALTFAILERPIVLIPLPDSLFTSGSLGDCLYRTAWHLQKPSDLQMLIDRAMVSFPLEDMRELSKKIYTYPGEGADRMTKALHSLLEFAPMN